MQLAIAAAAGAGLLAAVLVAGCDSGAPPAHGASAQACTDYGVRAIEQHRVVRREPAECRGLSRGEINGAMARAVDLSVGGISKASRRRRVIAGGYLTYLITQPAPPPAAPAPPGGFGSPASGGPAAGRGSTEAAALGALLAWLIAAGLGFYLLGVRVSRAGLGLPGAAHLPLEAVGHPVLAVTGLIVWIGYLAAGWTILGWIAVGLVILTAGLGMALLALRSRGHPPALVVAGHGAFATATMLLTLLAVVGAG